MIAPWMIYAMITGLLFGIAAQVLERAIRQWGRPIRALWVGAMLASLALPVVAWVRPAFVQPTLAGGDVPRAESPSPAGVTGEGRPPRSEPSWRASSRRLDPWLIGVWAALTTALVGWLSLTTASLHRRAQGWVRQEVDGREVWLSLDLGPAVVGVFRPRVVLPTWAAERGVDERALMIAHETEHVRARDPQLILSALLILVASPWNPALWWQWRRLRQAIEVDCDLRVLRRGVDPRAYCRLLVDVSERGPSYPLAVAALSERHSFLERRIRLMLRPQLRRWRLRALASGAIASACIVAACRMDRPERTPIPATGAMMDATGATQDIRPARSTQQAARLAVERYHPELLTQPVPGGTAYVAFIINTRGEIEASAIDTQGPSPIGARTDHPTLLRLFPQTRTWEKDWVIMAGSMALSPQVGPNEVKVISWIHEVSGPRTGAYAAFVPELPIREFSGIGAPKAAKR